MSSEFTVIFSYIHESHRPAEDVDTANSFRAITVFQLICATSHSNLSQSASLRSPTNGEKNGNSNR